ncbi:hypothetical protein PsAD46_04561 [Pseudovibrio sp. Ad46]|uniref:iron-sulfur cluster assembly scaffold protein n=1 Tax=unclassified Pseudovibrio TaxID=2627060 RepID=UPI0007AE8D3B|nr:MULTISPECIES: iron-sulfur cluster assembly scaffold protein [unclassified Pseudovibrio]KZK77539.1 hypothetical protein PsAD46_04561 [Pseudovibrio sp. Ad46]KZK93409.1 hypothetical protein PsAD5_03125 [Pseudovibrio sp. Ad5]
MLDDIYNTKILEFAGNIPLLGHLDAPQAQAKAHSRLCGSTVSVEVCVADGLITSFAQDVKACALGQASASILGQHVIGASPSEIREAYAQLHAMLKENGPPPVSRFADLSFLEPVREYKARHASTMLAFEALVKALDDVEATVA